jgi:hypothetical protein
MRANSGTSVALHASVSVPLRNLNGDAALLLPGGVGRRCTTRDELGGRKLVTLHSIDGHLDVTDPLGVVVGDLDRGVSGLEPFLGVVLDGGETSESMVDGVEVLVDNGLTLLGVCLLDRLLVEGDCLLDGHDTAEGKEDRLHDTVDVAAETSLLADLVSVDHVDLGVTAGKLALEGGRELSLKSLDVAPSAVDDEGTALLKISGKWVLGDVSGVVDGDVVSLRDGISGGDLLGAETKMASCDTTSLVSSEEEVSLRIEISVHSDELDSKTVGTDGTIAAKAPEDALLGALGNGVEGLANGERSVAHIIVDTNGEAVLGLSVVKVLVDSSGHGGSESLITKTEAATDDLHAAGVLRVEDAGADVEVKGLTAGARLLGTIKNSDALDGLWKRVDEVLGAPWAEEVDLADTNLGVAGLVEVLCSFDASTAASTHEADDALSVLRTDVLKERELAASDGRDFLHGLLECSGCIAEELMVGFDTLEVSVTTLESTADGGVAGVGGTSAVSADGILGDELLEVLVGDGADLCELVAEVETIKEVHDRQRSLEGSDVSDCGVIHALLDGVAAEDADTSLTDGHDIAVLTKDG